MKKNKHRGSSFDDFLKKEGYYELCGKEAMKRLVKFEKRLRKRMKNSTDPAHKELQNILLATEKHKLPWLKPFPVPLSDSPKEPDKWTKDERP